MALDLVAVLRRLGVQVDSNSPPITAPGVITWRGRIYDVSPELSKLGVKEGMEVWSSGKGFAPLDITSVETWLFDVPRGDHLLIAERKLSFEILDSPSRDGRTLKIWELNDLAAFIGHAVLDGRIQIIEEKNEVEAELEEDILSGEGPFVLKPKNDFSELELLGLDISLAKPVLIPANLHKVTGLLKGPDEEQICRWVLNCGGIHILEEIELLENSPMIPHENLKIQASPDFSELLSERRPHSDGMGDLLRWWYFDGDNAQCETYNVLVPAHKGLDATGSTWILNGVSNKLHLNQ